ncbi:hypothetical protein KSP39_PZI002756 [Platanthera zijinensis]|uniref:Uncharacterized protein n=1 Tax=Platanthera zijinensis TaxID=2320716 RepID=A0AAP0BYT7_9ASPA
MEESEAENPKKKRRMAMNTTEDPAANSTDSPKQNQKRKKKKSKPEEFGRKNEISSVSIAVMGSIINNTQSQELATLLAGQIARAATIFQVDEVVVVDNKALSCNGSAVGNCDGDESGAQFLVRILQYLETPQYLRRRLFPMHSSLKHVGLLPPLDAPHHVRKHEWSPFREGVTLKVNSSDPRVTLVDVGLTKNIKLEQVVKPGLRVTVAMGADRNIEAVSLQVVGRNGPRQEMGIYWGYTVRYASNLSSIFKGCPYKGGYDYIVGTSEHGAIINASELSFPKFEILPSIVEIEHTLISCAALAGFHESISEKTVLEKKVVNDVINVFVNVCPHPSSERERHHSHIFCSRTYSQDQLSRALVLVLHAKESRSSLCLKEILFLA